MTTKTIEKTEVEEQTEITYPSEFKVILHNDDVTTFEFVIHILTSIFDKNMEEAFKITNYIHKYNSSIVGIYSFQVAETKVDEVHQLARANNFPLTATFEEV